MRLRNNMTKLKNTDEKCKPTRHYFDAPNYCRCRNTVFVASVSNPEKQGDWERDFRDRYEGANVWSSKSIDDAVDFIKQRVEKQTRESVIDEVKKLDNGYYAGYVCVEETVLDQLKQKTKE